MPPAEWGSGQTVYGRHRTSVHPQRGDARAPIESTETEGNCGSLGTIAVTCTGIQPRGLTESTLTETPW